jgi:hypothetical protein
VCEARIGPPGAREAAMTVHLTRFGIHVYLHKPDDAPLNGVAFLYSRWLELGGCKIRDEEWNVKADVEIVVRRK